MNLILCINKERKFGFNWFKIIDCKINLNWNYLLFEKNKEYNYRIVEVNFLNEE